MIRPLHRVQDPAVRESVPQPVGNDKVIDPPADILLPGTEAVAPPGISDFLRVQVAERVRKAGLEQFRERCPLLITEAGIEVIAVGVFQIDFLMALFEEAHRRRISTVLDTAAQPFTRKQPFFGKFEHLMESTNLILLDIKHIDDTKHKILTGHTNENILDCARFLSDIGKPVWIRHVLVPGINDSEEDLSRTADFIRTLKNVEKVEVLPYHTLGVFKWEEMGLRYALKGVEPPTEESVAMAKRILSAE